MEDLNLRPVGKTEDVRSLGESIDVVGPEELIEKIHSEVEYLDTPVKSPNDKRDYRTIKLPNGLTALLISDVQSIPNGQIDNSDDEDDNDKCADQEKSQPEVKDQKDEEDDKVAGDLNGGDVDTPENKRPKKEEKMAACSLCVGVGSFSDPPEIPGMAHFLEHMVFMGSEKYPQENDFDAFIKKHGGVFNAFTGCERTRFFVDIQEKHLLAALDRMAQFFISPLMMRDAITREREAVDSEFQLAVQSDFCREEQLFCSLAQPGHPATKFTWGNLVTLRDNVTDDKLYEELHKFRQRHYSAHRMTLAIQARLPMDTLERYVKDCFSTVPNNGLPPDDFTLFKGIQSFDTPAFHRMYKIKPIRDFCEIKLTWTMPSLHHLYKSKPGRHVSWIIGHEGKGSLTSYLRKKMWCLDLGCGVGCSDFSHTSMYSLFSLSLKLTDEGQKHVKEILDAVFSYISLVRKSGPQKRIYDEIHEIRENSFRFKDEIWAASYVLNLSDDMHFYAPSDYITGSELYSEYNPTEIKACMHALTPDSANIIVFDKKFDDSEFDKVEPWFNTKYTDMEIPKDWIEHWRKIEPLPEFHLPEPNVFITDDFSLVPLPEDVPKYPTKIHSDSMSEVWFRPDPKFKIPESYMYYYFISPLALTTPENAALMDLLVAILKHLLVEELYPASIAELSYHIISADKGIVVAVSGFNQKLPLLLSTVTKYMADCPNLVTQNLFDVMKAEILKDYYNSFVGPNCLSYDVKQSILRLVHWTEVDKHAALSGVEFYRFETFAKQFFSRIYMQCLVQGNIAKEDVIENWQNCVEILKCRPLLPNTSPQLRVTQIPLGTQYCRVKNFNKTDKNSVVTNVYQSGIGNIKISVILDLLMMLMDEPVSTQLRTKEQLGYSVYCYSQDTFGIVSYSVTVCTQADKFTAEHIDERIENFLKSFLEILEKLSEKDFNSVKVALVKLEQCVDLNLHEEINRNWAEITNGEYMFDRQDKQIDALNGMEIVDLKKWMEKHVLGGNNLRKLSIQVVGKSQEKEEIENESNGENKILKNSQESTETERTSDNGVSGSHNSSVEYSNDVKYPLEYVKGEPNDKDGEQSQNYITNIDFFKKTLYVYPSNHTSTQ